MARYQGDLRYTHHIRLCGAGRRELPFHCEETRWIDRMLGKRWTISRVSVIIIYSNLKVIIIIILCKMNYDIIPFFHRGAARAVIRLFGPFLQSMVNRGADSCQHSETTMVATATSVVSPTACRILCTSFLPPMGLIDSNSASSAVKRRFQEICRLQVC